MKKRTMPTAAPKHRTIEELGLRPGSITAQIIGLRGQVPDEEWEKLPRDGSYQHDHYLHGAPKKDVEKD